MTITRPILRYHGGKWRIAPWIISHFPRHTHYCEVFGGSAAVLLRKTPAEVETYNDLDHGVVSFFRVLRERPVELTRAIELTPWAREEIRIARTPADDELESARRLFVAAWMGRGKATTQWSTGWRYEVGINRGTRAYKDILGVSDNLMAVAARLKCVQIECDEALRVIRRFDSPGTLFYVDPPYVSSTRSDRWSTKAYRHEMTDEDHRQLAGLLHSIRGMAVVSGYPSALYDGLYAGWQKRTLTTRCDGGTKAIECLWINSSAAQAAPQASMFSTTEVYP